MPKKALDSNLIIYSLLEDHPASAVCDALLRSPKYTFYATPITPFEVYFVLRRVYGVLKDEAASKALALFDTPLRFVEVGMQDAQLALKRAVTYDIDMNDSLLIQESLRLDIPSLSSDDRRLLKVCEGEGVHPQTPIGEEHRKKMGQWEEERLHPRVYQGSSRGFIVGYERQIRESRVYSLTQRAGFAICRTNHS